jgi:carbon starvation protein
VANQLLATLALALGTTWLLHHGKRRYAWVTLAPFLYLSFTVITAGVENIFSLYLPRGDILNTVLSAALLLMVAFVVVDSVRLWISLARGPRGEGASAPTMGG